MGAFPPPPRGRVNLVKSGHIWFNLVKVVLDGLHEAGLLFNEFDGLLGDEARRFVVVWRLLGGVLLEDSNATFEEVGLALPDVDLAVFGGGAVSGELGGTDSDDGLGEALEAGVLRQFAVADSLEELGGDEGDGTGGEAVVVAGRKAGGIASELGDLLAGLAVLEPVLEAALTPFGEVDVVDGLAVEEVGEDRADLWEVVEPREDALGGLAVGQALVEFLADLVREPSSFSGSSHDFR